MSHVETLLLPVEIDKIKEIVDIKEIHKFIPYIIDTKELKNSNFKQTVNYENNTFNYTVQELNKEITDDYAVGDYIVYIEQKIKIKVPLKLKLTKQENNLTKLDIIYELEPMSNSFINRGIISIVDKRLNKEYIPVLKEKILKNI